MTLDGGDGKRVDDTSQPRPPPRPSPLGGPPSQHPLTGNAGPRTGLAPGTPPRGRVTNELCASKIGSDNAPTPDGDAERVRQRTSGRDERSDSRVARAAAARAPQGGEATVESSHASSGEASSVALSGSLASGVTWETRERQRRGPGQHMEWAVPAHRLWQSPECGPRRTPHVRLQDSGPARIGKQ